MKAVLLSLLLSIPAFATSTPITTFQLSGVGSGLSIAGSTAMFWASDPSKNFSYELTATNTTGSASAFTGGTFSLRDGSTYLYGDLEHPNLSGNIFSGSFAGDEIMRLGPNDWVYWRVVGTLQQSVNFSAPLGTGSINITASTFEGKYPEAPEPGTWALVGTGLAGLFFARRRLIHVSQ